MPSIRNIAVGLPVKDGCVLVLEGFDRVRELTFYRAIGGGIEFGETAAMALRREFREELDCDVDSARLLGVVENIFEFEGTPGHEIAHVFEVTAASLSALPLDGELVVLDEGSPVRWVPIDALGPNSPPLFPEGAAASSVNGRVVMGHEASGVIIWMPWTVVSDPDLHRGWRIGSRGAAA